MRLTRLFVAASCAALASALAAPAAFAGDGPPGFWYGADSDGPGPVGSGVEYTMPTCSGAYGSYVGRIDSGSDPYNKPAYSNAANANAASGYGVGSQNYYDLAGPLADPSYDGSASEAVSWGEYQGQLAIDNWVTFYVTDGNLLPGLPVIYADMESGNPGYGSNAVLNRDVFNGFWNVVHDARVTINPHLPPVTLSFRRSVDGYLEILRGVTRSAS